MRIVGVSAFFKLQINITKAVKRPEMRRRTLIWFRLNCFVMLFWYPVFERMLEDIIWMALHLPFSTKACFSTLHKIIISQCFDSCAVSFSLCYVPSSVSPCLCLWFCLFIHLTVSILLPAILRFSSSSTLDCSSLLLPFLSCLLSIIYTSQYLTVIFRAQELCEQEGGLGSHSLSLRP